MASAPTRLWTEGLGIERAWADGEWQYRLSTAL